MIGDDAEILLRTEHGTLAHDRRRDRVILVRNRARLEVEALRSEVDALIAAVAGIPIGAADLVLDIRAPVGNNDDAFEAAVRDLLGRFVSRFRRTVILVRTIAGRLQGQRIVRGTESGPVVITDDVDAVDRILGR
ncbi:MAG: hypothetical protein H6711_06545 [Myxococcales bacterium]|nr:hypothetical protein [Myxococcales bacterium]